MEEKEEGEEEEEDGGGGGGGGDGVGTMTSHCRHPTRAYTPTRAVRYAASRSFFSPYPPET